MAHKKKNTSEQLYEESVESLDGYIKTSDYAVPLSMRLEMVDEQRVLTIIDGLQSKAATGNDGISAKFLQRYKHRLAQPITASINNAISTGTWPQSLKCASVVPVPKTANASRFTEYRPIAVLCALNMVFEELVKSWLTELLKRNEIIHPNQFGFEKGSNTETAVLHLTHFLARRIHHTEVRSLLCGVIA